MIRLEKNEGTTGELNQLQPQEAQAAHVQQDEQT